MRLATLGMISLLILVQAKAQREGTYSLSLDQLRPYVEIVFERDGPRAALHEGEDNRGRIRCREEYGARHFLERAEMKHSRTLCQGTCVKDAQS